MKANNKTISAASLRAKVDRDLFLITQDVKIEDFKRNVNKLFNFIWYSIADEKISFEDFSTVWDSLYRKGYFFKFDDKARRDYFDSIFNFLKSTKPEKENSLTFYFFKYLNSNLSVEEKIKSIISANIGKIFELGCFEEEKVDEVVFKTMSYLYYAVKDKKISFGTARDIADYFLSKIKIPPRTRGKCVYLIHKWKELN